MRSTFNRWCIPFLLPLLLLSILAFSAAGQPEPAHARTDTFVIGDISPPYNMDPAQTSAMIDFRLLRGMYETLVVLGDDGITAEPGAAESWEVSDDGLTYTFHLREDAKWSDGTPVTAVDFVAGWFRALLPDTWGDYASLHFAIEGARDFYEWRLDMLNAYHAAGEEVGFEQILEDLRTAQQRYVGTVGVLAVDEFTLQVRLEHPVAYFPQLVSMLTFAPLPRVQLEPERLNYHVHGAARVHIEYFTDPELVICNGPYRLDYFEEGGSVGLVANAHYWGRDAVKSEYLAFDVYEMENALLAAYERGEVDWVPTVYSSDVAERLLDSGHAEVHLIEREGTYYYEFNCRPDVGGLPNPFADRTLRRAFAHAMDRIERCCYPGGVFTPLQTFLPPGIIAGYDAPTHDAIPFDLERAAELLEEAGYPDGDGLAEFVLLTNSSGVSARRNEEIAASFQGQWADALGVLGAHVQHSEFAAYLEASQDGHFHIRRAGWFGDYPDPTTFLDLQRRGNPSNHSGYDSDVFNALMDAADAELDPDARLALLREAEALLLQDAVVVPLYRYGTVSLYNPERVRVPLNAWMYIRLEHLELLQAPEPSGE